MSETPNLTIVIPTRNRVHLLPRAVQSVLVQPENFELVVVDDASTDRTHDFLRSVKDARFRYLRHRAPGGAAAARNQGIQAARSPVVTFLDDDDEWLPHFATRTLAAIKSNPDAGFFWCGAETVEDTAQGEKLLGRQIWNPKVASLEEAYLMFLSDRYIGTGHGLTVRRTALEKSGLFDERLRCAEDTDLLIRLARVVPFVVIPQVLVRIHVHEGPRLTRYRADMANAYRCLAEKHSEALAKYPKIYQKFHYKIGWMVMHAGRPREGRRELVKAWRRAPWNLKPLAMLVFFTLTGRWGSEIHQFVSKCLQNRKALWRREDVDIPIAR